MKKVPSVEQKEWGDLLTGHSEVKLANFFLRTKVEQNRNLVNQGKITISSAISDLREICVELSKTRDIDDDMDAIFGKDFLKKQSVTTKLIKENINKFATAEDITSRINKIQIEAALKRETFQKEKELSEPRKKTNTINKEKLLVSFSETKTNDNSKTIDVDKQKEILRKASIARRNKILKENRALHKTKDKSSLGSIIKSIFN